MSRLIYRTWASSRVILILLHENNKGANQPAHLRKLMRAANCVRFCLNPFCREVHEGCLPHDKTVHNLNLTSDWIIGLDIDWGWWGVLQCISQHARLSEAFAYM